MSNEESNQLRRELDEVNLDLSSLINKCAQLVQHIGQRKQRQGMNG